MKISKSFNRTVEIGSKEKTLSNYKVHSSRVILTATPLPLPQRLKYIALVTCTLSIL
jgi:hypothetical protein